MSRQTRLDWFSSRAHTQAAHRDDGRRRRLSHRRPLRFEPLEDRRLLSITVDTLVDENDGVGVSGTSLREAIAAAMPGDTIDFGVTGTITLEHGELLVDKSLAIQGPGAKLLTIDADGASRVFNVDDGNAALGSVAISGLTITGGVTNGDGGGIFNRETLTVTACEITGNSADDGGGIGNFSGTFSLVDSTVSNNSASGANGGGGGIFMFSTNKTDTSTILNSTISANDASTTTGGGVYNFHGTLFVRHSTITDNVAHGNLGSGIATLGDVSEAVTIVRSSIVAGNTNSDIDVVVGSETAISSEGFNLIGFGNVTGVFTFSGDERFASDAELKLGPLADYGGATRTHACCRAATPSTRDLPPFSPPPLFDQRGEGFDRVVDGNSDAVARIDKGAFEADGEYLFVDVLDDEFDGDTGPGDLSLREALDLANSDPGRTIIRFDPALFAGGPATIDLIGPGELVIASELKLVGPGADQLTIDAHQLFRALRVDDGLEEVLVEVDVSGVTLTGGLDGGGGGGIRNLEKLTLSDSVVTGNFAKWGAGIYNHFLGDLTLLRSTISDNTVISPSEEDLGSGGGIYNWGGLAAVVDATIAGNSAPQGAGIKNVSGGVMSLELSYVSGNIAERSGGGIANIGSSLDVATSIISGNSAGIGGGGLYADAATTNLSDTTISGNSAPDGGGIRNRFGSELTLQRSTISGNMAVGGVDTFNSGGGIRNDGGMLNVLDSTFSGNSAGYGAALYVDTELDVVTTISNSTISDNVATGGGGGIFNFRGHLFVAHSTITDNEAPNLQGSGVGSWADLLITFTEVYSTILVGNRDTDVDLVGGPGIEENTIQSNDYNLIGTGDGVGSFDQLHDAVVTPEDVKLAPLADNGGPTWTHKLLTGSVAIDAGNPDSEAGVDGVPNYDQRGMGFDRIRDGDAAEDVAIDVGAFEVQQFVAGPALPGDYNLDETVDAADYTVWRDTLGQDVAAFYDGADGDGDGMIDEDDYGVWKANFGNTLSDPGGAAFGGGASGGEPILVTTIADTVDLGDGVTSLREAIFAANIVDGPDTIEFAASLTAGGPATILLTLGQLAISDSLTINGPGANLLSIDASGNDPTPDSTLADGDDTNDGDGSRIFDIDDGIADSAIEVAISGLTLTGADAGGYGGAIQTREILTLREAAISGNFSFGGGGIYAHLQPLVVENSTISGNAAVNGGGIFGTEITINNSTISGNAAFSRGGGILSYAGEVKLSHSTVTGNQTEADTDDRRGGGIFRYLEQLTVLDHTIVANNLSAGIVPDDLVADVTARFSLIGNGTDLTIVDEGGNLIGASEEPLDPLLAPLADNGGPTKTHALRPLSPALDAGDSAAVAGIGGVPEFDQRGTPFTRVFDVDGVGGAQIDLGAYEAAPFTFVVDTLADELDGNYTPGDFSLREALELANTRAGHDTIEFLPDLTAGGPATILLSMGELAVADAVTINGPGAELLAVDASGNDLNPDVLGDGSRIFNVDNNNSAISIDVEIRGLTLTGGDTDQGGAILSRESLFGESIVVTGNQAMVGGAIAILNFGGGTTIADSTIVQNKASSQGGAFFIQSSTVATATIRDSTISGNMAVRGGALYAAPSLLGAALILTDNTIADNTADQQGGAIFLASTSTPKTTIRSSTLSGNMAGSHGGAIVANGARDLTIVDSRILDNKNGLFGFPAARGGGIYAINSEIAISGSTISGNIAAIGGGISSRNGELAISFSTIANNTATAGDGGGIDSGGDRLSIIGSTISGNTAIGFFSQLGRGGGLSHSIGPLALTTIVDTTFADNSSSNYGGGADFRSFSEGIASSLTLTNVDFTGNTSARGGGLVFSLGGQGRGGGLGLLTVTDGSITGNTATMHGGGVYGRVGSMLANGTTISGNIANLNGGGIASSTLGDSLVSFSLVGVTIHDNHASVGEGTGNGGGLWLPNSSNSLTLIDTEISNNSADRGGGIFRGTFQSVTSGMLSAVDSTISGNTATLQGGGIYSVGGSLLFTRSAITGNTAAVSAGAQTNGGGGIFNRNADISLVNSSVSGNSAMFGRGGGLYMTQAGDLTVTGTTIAGNSARSGGGGVWLQAGPGDRATILSSTVSGNTSDLGTGGLSVRGNLTIRHSTIIKNFGGRIETGGFVAGGVSFEPQGGTLELDHAIVAGNLANFLAPPDLRFQSAQFVTLRYSLIGDNTGTPLAEAPVGSPDINGNLIGKPVARGGGGVIDPLLGPLAQNGGPTLTHALLPGSPALDAGTLVSGPPQGFDQRGNPFSRMVDGTGDGVVRIDMGAYESQGVPSFSPGDYSRNGIVDAADYTIWRNTLSEAPVTPFSGADGNGSGVVDLEDYSLWKNHFGAGLVFALGGGSIAVPEPVALALSAPSLAYASQPPALPAVGRAADRFASQTPARVDRESDALIAWLATQPRGVATDDDTFAWEAPENAAGDAEADTLETAMEAAFATFGF